MLFHLNFFFYVLLIRVASINLFPIRVSSLSLLYLYYSIAPVVFHLHCQFSNFYMCMKANFHFIKTTTKCECVCVHPARNKVPSASLLFIHRANLIAVNWIIFDCNLPRRSKWAAQERGGHNNWQWV